MNNPNEYSLQKYLLECSVADRIRTACGSSIRPPNWLEFGLMVCQGVLQIISETISENKIRKRCNRKLILEKIYTIGLKNLTTEITPNLDFSMWATVAKMVDAEAAKVDPNIRLEYSVPDFILNDPAALDTFNFRVKITFN